ncbi:hypothetical protein J7T55_008334 [Diaporthe amygdali]|uniref:uncharacterized protein n=1 Tax=Phomopsis amygdali TaxID=1214568 RepID=UPI0022FEB78D|nr:uncharacterized protein J7T55_008334 [Diaporthe amygdali]KAJ0121172.1 hypothetical protein J7T55_008334 [Diaporthe amygdali]
MCFTEGKSRRHYQETRKRAEAQVKKNLRQAGKVESNRQNRLFAPSNSSVDEIRTRTLAKAKQNRSQAPPVPVINDSSESSLYPAPLNIRKKTPQQQRSPPQAHGQQADARPTHLGDTTPALRTAVSPADQSDIHPALRSEPQTHRRRASTASQSSLEREIYAYLGTSPGNSPRESEVSLLNITEKLPYTSSRRR